MIINLFWKISLHTAFVTASVAVLIIVYGEMAVWTIIFVPLIAWARLEMRLHSPPQVFTGGLLAVSIVIIVFGLFGFIW
jgi:membrane-associated phospholipid phosphatase